ncbi:protein ROOT PRIMORDIUM DEFECTIVE 1 [Phalaenopsis equestris]|uniref:protein ROOT PRIMORDIUM DEFECTIVE 1 n=1 Tax=Phalaenopsis equestris TaxID=78828 RepID=UPI0009E24799|nr:protein ROOT PRIMORDIUM DEFECTIVE 1 [Phalaenopsis equestris]XP_020573359.1 protein ROOT PRIMORDIUM DEFECTIVE 1 [Phalaenopsis equestris]XP_020573360.1 protein ROOT PRIMORDIUM DEFECTIVE 1 [Phalaenopsis equestris]
MLLDRRLRENILLRCSKTLEALWHLQKASYVDVTMKWKKDPFFDNIDILSKSRDLRPLISLKNIIIKEPDQCLPISAVSKRSRELDISGRVASFLRRYPAVFEEFTGPEYNLPWFRLTREAFDIDLKERDVYLRRRMEIVGRLRRLILMSREKMLPLRIVQGMLWYLGLSEDFLKIPEEISDEFFRIVEVEGEERWLCAEPDSNEEILSVLQKNAMKQGSCDQVTFPLFPSKGLRLKKKIECWLDDFQRLPYVSPYEDFSSLDPNSDVSEKRVAGVLHELLSIFVDNSAERRRLLCLRKHLGLPQKFHKVFERHPHVFYLLLKSKTCFVVLKEAYNGCSVSTIERHPMLEVRKKYVELMNRSEAILRSRRSRKPLVEIEDESYR